MRTAAKTMIKLLSGANSKAWRFFVMKRATGRVVGARFFKRDTFVYHIDDINAIQQFLYKTFRNQDLSALKWMLTISKLNRQPGLILAHKTKKERIAPSFLHSTRR